MIDKKEKPLRVCLDFVAFTLFVLGVFLLAYPPIGLKINA